MRGTLRSPTASRTSSNRHLGLPGDLTNPGTARAKDGVRAATLSWSLTARWIVLLGWPPGGTGICGPGCRGFKSRHSPHGAERVTCGFSGSPNFFLAAWLETWLETGCDADHM
jgi:hypothetical protein